MTGSCFLITDDLAIPWSELSFTAVRSSGPGGQNVNKVSSKVLLRWQFADSEALSEFVRARFARLNGNRINTNGQVVITSDRYRDQLKNKDDALAKLAELVITAATPPKRRTATRPTRGSQQRRLQNKKQRSETKRQRRPPTE